MGASMRCVFVQVRCQPGKTYEVADAIYEREVGQRTLFDLGRL